jgi:hypothetical protein
LPLTPSCQPPFYHPSALGTLQLHFIILHTRGITHWTDQDVWQVHANVDLPETNRTNGVGLAGWATFRRAADQSVESRMDSSPQLRTHRTGG